ncbi:type VI secretion system lipoprotein TssJ [Xanthomonas euvesicatoria]|uniref:type VI secretion system lipoprotein TssJ n=1 Tax=Xanthomonas citri TaxID=346 RepID=UPI000F8094DE|nr:type VI secretion system lipoprotein TssJ [Xanthomonas axonopodis]MEE5091845.1 type VI secretion system lipoprotein TssJ [Xanthomonas euvesicatoria]RTE56880.1 type VI secretion system lipoprotein TssJ [Xanthomonas axonopodis pv. eucalyptorum]
MNIATHRFNFLLALVAATLALSGCASGGIGKAVDKSLQAVGIKEAKPEAPPMIPLRLFAGGNLNASTDTHAAAAVVKIYHLRSAQRFEQAAFNAFLDQAGEQAALGADLLSVNEIVLTPSARQELNEQMSEGTTILGVVALFRAPAEGRWRMAFDTRRKELPTQGITIGIHACALTTDSPALVTRLAGDPSSLASVRCAAAR